MNKNLSDAIQSSTSASLREWAEPAMVERGTGYVENVLEVLDVEDVGVVAKLHGTEDYFSRVFLDNGGNLESECSCPVGCRCKHGVATILKCAQTLKSGEPIATRPASDAFWQSAEDAIAAEQFLAWMGYFEYYRSVESFHRLLDEAEKADVRDDTVAAIGTTRLHWATVKRRSQEMSRVNHHSH